ncbi:MAG: PA2169 family four-helix-bundle protein [Acidimicrobiales bacterium]|nr:PA2169 family four-helix-bundle protein [Acidimicrobiales bacterium]
MSQDKSVTKDLIETLEDGKDGFTHAAAQLSDSGHSDLAAKMRDYAQQRARFSQQLEALAAHYGDDIDENGSLVAGAHRVWMSMKDALTGSDPSAVFDVAEQGEDHAVKEYVHALEQDISPELREVVQRQLTEIRAAHDDVRSLREAVS